MLALVVRDKATQTVGCELSGSEYFTKSLMDLMFNVGCGNPDLKAELCEEAMKTNNLDEDFLEAAFERFDCRVGEIIPEKFTSIGEMNLLLQNEKEEFIDKYCNEIEF